MRRHRLCHWLGCDTHWVPIPVDGHPSTGMARVCRRCNTHSNFTNVHIAVAAGIDACVSTDMHPAPDWPGCRD